MAAFLNCIGRRSVTPFALLGRRRWPDRRVLLRSVVMMGMIVCVIMVGVIVPLGVIMIMMRGLMMIVVVMVMLIVVMVSVIVMIMIVLRLTFILHQRLELFAGDLLFRDLGLGHDVIDDLLLEHRAAQFDSAIGVLAVEVEHLALLAGELAGPVEQGALQFVVADADAGLFADRRRAPGRDARGARQGAVFLARVFLGGLLVGEGAGRRASGRASSCVPDLLNSASTSFAGGSKL